MTGTLEPIYETNGDGLLAMRRDRYQSRSRSDRLEVDADGDERDEPLPPYADLDEALDELVTSRRDSLTASGGH